MDQNNNPDFKIKTEEKKIHRIGKAEYILTPGIGENKDWVSFEEACTILTLKIDQIRKLSASLNWPKKYDMAGRVMNTFVPKQVVTDYLHTKNFHEASDAEHKPAADGGPAGQEHQDNGGEGKEKFGDQNKLPIQIQNEFKELARFKEFASGVLKMQEDKIHTLETKTETLEAKREELTKELLNEKEVKSNLKITNNNLKIFLALSLVGAGVATGFYIYTNKDNDRLYDEKRKTVGIITSLNMENSNLNVKTKMQDDEIQILKKQIPESQNEEINAVKKD
jgi:hypothetical protein